MQTEAENIPGADESILTLHTTRKSHHQCKHRKGNRWRRTLTYTWSQHHKHGKGDGWGGLTCYFAQTCTQTGGEGERARAHKGVAGSWKQQHEVVLLLCPHLHAFQHLHPPKLITHYRPALSPSPYLVSTRLIVLPLVHMPAWNGLCASTSSMQ